tara:strand:+ start:495 stop:653 length:159 start_codon:yes stop_codon:yes gene_type:complete
VVDQDQADQVEEDMEETEDHLTQILLLELQTQEAEEVVEMEHLILDLLADQV